MRVAVAVLVVVVLAPGCSGKDATEDREPVEPPVAAAEAPNAAELRWIGELEEWHGITTSLAPGGCEQSFDRDVGQAPSERLRSVGLYARAACVDLVRGLDLEQTALSHGDGDGLAEANELIRKSEAGLEAALNRVRTVVPDVEKPLPSVASPSPRSRTDPALSQVATRVVGSRVEIRCWNKEDWRRLSGLQETLAFVTESAAHFGTRDCARLAGLRGKEIAISPQTARLVQTFAHELEHLGGNDDEDVTECYAMQAMDETGVALGLASRAARALQTLFWRDLYELNSAEYRSTECRDGGSQDLDLVDPRWP
jgi:hypothetical protein